MSKYGRVKLISYPIDLADEIICALCKPNVGIQVCFL